MKPYLLAGYNFLKIRLAAAKHGASIFVGGGVELFSRNTKFLFKKGSRVSIGNHIVTDGRCVIIADQNAELRIGNHVYMNENAMISCKEKIIIGDGCKFGPNVSIFDNNHRFSAEGGVSDIHKTGEVQIGKACWLGANVVVLKGSIIGDNCLIGAGCVIDCEIPACSVVTQGRDLRICPLRKDKNEEKNSDYFSCDGTGRSGKEPAGTS